MTYHTSAAVEDNEIYRNAHGIVDDCCNGPAIRRNRVHHNDGYGIRTGYADIEIVEDNLIENNGGIGLAVGYSGPVQDNVVRNNAVGVAATSWLGTYVSLHNNDIYDNTDANLEIRTDRTGTWDCTSNWWGTTDPAVIAEMIWDCNDDPELLICVEFDPFCTSPGCEPTAVEATTWGGVKALYRD